MLLCVVSAHSQSFEVDGISYNVTNELADEVEVTGGETREEIEIPETVSYNEKNYTVTSIGSNAFAGSPAKKFVIPGTVKTINYSAFYDNYSLEEVQFNEGLQTIGDAAFAYNFALKEIRLPSTLLSIGEGGFLTNQNSEISVYCSAATPPNIVSNTFQGRTTGSLHVTVADVEAYRVADNWKDFSEIIGDISYANRCYTPVITYDNGLISMSCNTEGATIYYTTDGTNPDENANRYTSPIPFVITQIIRAIAIAEGLENSGVREFYDKEAIENITNITDEQGVLYTLKQADGGSFYYAVTGHAGEISAEIVIPEELNDCPVKTIEENAFRNCENLSSISISNSVTSIGTKAFWYCSNLTTIVLGSQLTTIGDYAFDRCSSLSSIEIPNSVTSLGSFAFASCGLTSVTIGNGIMNLKGGTFYGCRSLATISIPNSVTSIEDATYSYMSSDNSWQNGSFGVFSDCSGLTSVTIPNSVMTIGSNAFTGCGQLIMFTSQIQQPFEMSSGINWANVTLVVPQGTRASYMNTNGWTGAAFVYEEGETNYERELTDDQGLKYTLRLSDDYGIYYAVTGHSDELNEEIIIPSDFNGCPVKAIGDLAFYDCSGLTSVTIPNSVTSIGNDAFSGCSGLTSFIIPNSVTSIGGGVFLDCSSLTSVVIGNGITILQKATFAGCNSLITINIPNSITVIADGDTQIMGDGSIYYGIGVFSNCTSLQSVSIPNSMTYIGISAFSGCNSLTSITIPNRVTSIGSNAFSECNLISVTIPNSVTTIPVFNVSFLAQPHHRSC